MEILFKILTAFSYVSRLGGGGGDIKGNSGYDEITSRLSWFWLWFVPTTVFPSLNIPASRFLLFIVLDGGILRVDKFVSHLLSDNLWSTFFIIKSKVPVILFVWYSWGKNFWFMFNFWYILTPDIPSKVILNSTGIKPDWFEGVPVIL